MKIYSEYLFVLILNINFAPFLYSGTSRSNRTSVILSSTTFNNYYNHTTDLLHNNIFPLNHSTNPILFVLYSNEP